MRVGNQKGAAGGRGNPEQAGRFPPTPTNPVHLQSPCCMSIEVLLPSCTFPAGGAPPVSLGMEAIPSLGSWPLLLASFQGTQDYGDQLLSMRVFHISLSGCFCPQLRLALRKQAPWWDGTSLSWTPISSPRAGSGYLTPSFPGSRDIPETLAGKAKCPGCQPGLEGRRALENRWTTDIRQSPLYCTGSLQQVGYSGTPHPCALPPKPPGGEQSQARRLQPTSQGPRRAGRLAEQ